MSGEIEGSPEEIQSALAAESESFFGQQKEVQAALRSAGFDEMMDAYVEAAKTGKFSDPVEYSMVRSGETVPLEASSVKDYLTGAFRKYDTYARGESLGERMTEEQRAEYQKRADQVSGLLKRIESLSGSR